MIKAGSAAKNPSSQNPSSKNSQLPTLTVEMDHKSAHQRQVSRLDDSFGMGNNGFRGQDGDPPAPSFHKMQDDRDKKSIAVGQSKPLPPDLLQQILRQSEESEHPKNMRLTLLDNFMKGDQQKGYKQSEREVNPLDNYGDDDEQMAFDDFRSP